MVDGQYISLYSLEFLINVILKATYMETHPEPCAMINEILSLTVINRQSHRKRCYEPKYVWKAGLFKNFPQVLFPTVPEACWRTGQFFFFTQVRLILNSGCNVCWWSTTPSPLVDTDNRQIHSQVWCNQSFTYNYLPLGPWARHLKLCSSIEKKTVHNCKQLNYKIQVILINRNRPKDMQLEHERNYMPRISFCSHFSFPINKITNQTKRTEQTKTFHLECLQCPNNYVHVDNMNLLFACPISHMKIL